MYSWVQTVLTVFWAGSGIFYHAITTQLYTTTMPRTHPSHSSDNARSLTHCTTRELHTFLYLKFSITCWGQVKTLVLRKWKNYYSMMTEFKFFGLTNQTSSPTVWLSTHTPHTPHSSHTEEIMWDLHPSAFAQSHSLLLLLSASGKPSFPSFRGTTSIHSIWETPLQGDLSYLAISWHVFSLHLWVLGEQGPQVTHLCTSRHLQCKDTSVSALRVSSRLCNLLNK